MPCQYLRVWYCLMQMKDTYGEDPVRAPDVMWTELLGGMSEGEGEREGDANRLR